MFEEYPDILTVKDAMTIMRVSKDLIYELIQSKQLPAYRFGKKSWRLNKSDLIKHLTSAEK